MYKLLSVQIIEIDPDEAMRYLKLNTLSFQRKIKDSHVLLLADKMKDCKFRTGELAIAVDADKKRTLMNGQHQLMAVLMSGKTISAKLEIYSCKDMTEKSMLFRNFDTDVNNRTMSDAVSVEHEALKLPWPKEISKMLIRGVFLFNKQRRFMPKDEKVGQLSNLLPEGNFLAEVFKTKRPKHMVRPTVVGAMLQTFKKSPEEAVVFWSSVNSGEMLLNSDPAFKLREYLKTISVKGRLINRKPTTKKETYAKCIIAWNAYRRGRPTSLGFRASKPLPTAV